MATAHTAAATVREAKQDGLENLYRLLYNISYSLYKLDDMPGTKRVWRKLSRSKSKTLPQAIPGKAGFHDGFEGFYQNQFDAHQEKMGFCSNIDEFGFHTCQ